MKLDVLLISAHPDDEAGTLAGIEHIYDLDALDFFSTASAPLFREVWGGDELLGRIVRVGRATRPDVTITMNPSAAEGNPAQRRERRGAGGARGCRPQLHSYPVSSDLVFGAWEGAESARQGTRWSAVKNEAIWTYESQGWAEPPASPSDPASIVSTWLTLLHSRRPLVDPTTGNDAALRSATLPIEGGLPHRTQIEVTAERYEFVAGESLTARVTVTASSDQGLRSGTVALTAPEGWTGGESQSFPALDAGALHAAEFDLTASDVLEPGSTARAAATVTAGEASGASSTAVRASGALESTTEPLEEIGEFRDWTQNLGLTHLAALVPELFAVGRGRTRELTIVTHGRRRPRRWRIPRRADAGGRDLARRGRDGRDHGLGVRSGLAHLR